MVYKELTKYRAYWCKVEAELVATAAASIVAKDSLYLNAW